MEETELEARLKYNAEMERAWREQRESIALLSVFGRSRVTTLRRLRDWIGDGGKLNLLSRRFVEDAFMKIDLELEEMAQEQRWRDLPWWKRFFIKKSEM